jgi:hypothetical protein
MPRGSASWTLFSCESALARTVFPLCRAAQRGLVEAMTSMAAYRHRLRTARGGTCSRARLTRATLGPRPETDVAIGLDRRLPRLECGFVSHFGPRASWPSPRASPIHLLALRQRLNPRAIRGRWQRGVVMRELHDWRRNGAPSVHCSSLPIIWHAIPIVWTTTSIAGPFAAMAFASEITRCWSKLVCRRNERSCPGLYPPSGSCRCSSIFF